MGNFLALMEHRDLPYTAASWMFGKRHIFMNGETMHLLMTIKCTLLEESAVKIQATFRGWRTRQRLRKSPRHQKKHQTKQMKCILGGHDYNHNIPRWQPDYTQHVAIPPPLPEKRRYSVKGGQKVFFPQLRIMKESLNGKSQNE